MKRWLPAALLVAACFIAAVPNGQLVPAYGGGYWFFPIGAVNTIMWSPGLQAFFGTVRAGIQNNFHVQLSGGNGEIAPKISGNSDTISSVGLDLTSKGASSVSIYPGTNNPSAFVVKNMSGTVSELVTDTTSNFTKVIALNIASSTSTAPQPGTFSIERTSRSGSNLAPGPSAATFELVCGTTAGKAALVMYAGTSTVSFTVLNNIGAGISGC